MKKSWSTIKTMLHPLRWIIPSVLLLVAGGQIQAHENESTAIMHQQQATAKTITGKVVDSNGEPLIGVSVALKGTSTGIMTDIDGRYSLKVEGSNPQLVFTYVGHKAVTIAANKTMIDVTMHEDATMMEEVVVVGFGVQKKANLTGAVDAIDVSKALASTPVTDVAKGLQGLSAGLTVTNKSGSLGGDAKINIRGVGTMIDGKAAGSPLILVDGVPADLSLINPDDIESISILKDAASASIYGTRGAFGVILVTTKKGKSEAGKVKFSYSGNVGFSKPSNLIDFMDPTDELPVMMQAGKRKDGKMTEAFGMNHDVLLAGIQKWKERHGSKSHKDTNMVYGDDWEVIGGRAYTYRVWEPHKVMLKDWTPQTFHNLSAQGAMSEKSNFLVSLGYTSQDGFMRLNTDKAKRYNANVSLNTKLTSWLTSNVGVLFTRREIEEPFNFYNNSGTNMTEQNGYFGYYMRWGSYFPYGTNDGKYFRHAPGYLANADMNKNQKDLLRLNASLIAEITKDLTFNLEYSFMTEDENLDINGRSLKLLNFWAGGWDADRLDETAYQYVSAPGSATDKVARSSSKRNNHVFNAYANYRKTIDTNHNFSVTAGSNIESNEYRRFYQERRNVMDPSMPDINLGTGAQFTTAGFTSLNPAYDEYAIAGFFGRVNYDYAGKYLLELNGRYDGSSKFPRNKLWGFFPSASAGYRISDEAFMEFMKPIVNDAKIRLSAGSIGNQDVKLNAFRPMMNTSNADWITNGTLTSSVNAPTLYDTSLSWEKITTYDIGIDLKFNNNMFGLTFDWYQRENKDMLSVGKTLPQATGAVAPLVNAGNMRTRGWELGVDFNYPINKNILVYAKAMVSDYQSEITKWDNPNKQLGQLYAGMKVGEIWGFETDRLFQKDDFEADGKTLKSGIATQTGLQKDGFVFGAGDVKYKDLNDDGEINWGKRTADDSGDLKVIGNTTPRYQYSFRLGAEAYGFDFDIFFQGVGKRDYWANSDLILPLYNRTDALYGGMDDYWTEENTGAFFPNPFPGHAGAAVGGGVQGSNNFAQQSRYLLNMSYLRLKNLTVGYTLPRATTSKIGLDKVRVYFSGQNLAEFKSSRLPVDPEIDETEAAWGRTYPYPRTVSFGLQVNF